MRLGSRLREKQSSQIIMDRYQCRCLGNGMSRADIDESATRWVDER